MGREEGSSFSADIFPLLTSISFLTSSFPFRNSHASEELVLQDTVATGALTSPTSLTVSGNLSSERLYDGLEWPLYNSKYIVNVYNWNLESF